MKDEKPNDARESEVSNAEYRVAETVDASARGHSASFRDCRCPARTCGRRPGWRPTEGDTESRVQPHQCPTAEQHQFWNESRQPKSGRVEYSARETNWNLEKLEPARPLDYADHLPATAERTENSRNGRV